jgi:hypothetical protein
VANPDGGYRHRRGQFANHQGTGVSAAVGPSNRWRRLSSGHSSAWNDQHLRRQSADPTGAAIGIDCCSPDFGQFFATPSNPGIDFAELAIWGDPPLADGGAARVPDDSDSLELEINADIEPTTTFAISSVKQASKHRLRVSATFPNPGVLLVGDPRDPSVGAPQVGPRVPRGLLFRSSYAGVGGRRGETEPYTVSVLVIPTPRGRKLLRARGKLRGRIKLAYTPAYGGVAEQTTRFRLKQ